MSTSDLARSGSSSRLQRGFDRWAFEEYRLTGIDLGVFRVIYSLTAILLVLPDLDRLKGLQAASFRPPVGPLSLLSDWPAAWVLESLEVALAGALVLLLVGYRTPIMSWVVTVVLFTSLGLVYSAGTIGAGEKLFASVPVFMAAAGWGERFSIDHRRRRSQPPTVRAWPLALLALTIGLMYDTAARPKIQSGWLDRGTHAVQRTMLRMVETTFGGQGTVGEYSRVRNSASSRLLEISNGYIWELMDYSTVAVELLLIVLVWRRRSFIIGLCVVVLFHVSVYVVLEIGFQLHVIALGGFVRWGNVFDPLRPTARRVATRFGRLPRPASALAALGVVVVGFGVHLYADRGPYVGVLAPPTKAQIVPVLFWLFALIALWHLSTEAVRLMIGVLRRRTA